MTDLLSLARRRQASGQAVVAVLTITVVVASGCATSVPTLLPPATPLAEGDLEWRCLHEAESSFSAIPDPLDAAAKTPLGGRDTFGFLWWGSLSGPRPVANRQGHPSGGGESLLVIKTARRRELADRYVLCLLAQGFRWQEERR
jgi:hypothetical protein